MKNKMIISSIYVICATALVILGSCNLDLWTYLLCMAIAILFMLIIIKQEKKYDRIKAKILNDDLRK